MSVGEKSDNKNLPYHEPLLQDPATDDRLLNYLQDDKRLAEEIISRHIIARILVEFLWILSAINKLRNT
ncbi:MAG: hypothetical protein DLM72_01945 [Candidatus Nitrosopolaris wilkensis]|nr:MAG: hypothetical protein DLM72_01945 [Candidatus Nitrosopolaris wilkensis]